MQQSADADDENTSAVTTLPTLKTLSSQNIRSTRPKP